MAFIEVNHKTLTEVADAIDTYCDAQDKEMRSAHTAVSAMLLKDWIGKDATEFGNKWSGVDKSDSVTIQFRDSLKTYGDSLRACAKEYQKAQEDSYNEASYLPR